MTLQLKDKWAGSGFEDVREVEAKARQDHADYCKGLKQAIALCDGLLQLESSGGFRAFHETLSDMLLHRTAELLSARDDRAAAMLQGRCLELKQILTLMRETRTHREALANALTTKEHQWVDIERGFKPQGTNS